jgi:hypothetical protein
MEKKEVKYLGNTFRFLFKKRNSPCFAVVFPAEAQKTMLPV